jgi:hypothetical protein
MVSDFFSHRSTSFPSLQLHSHIEKRPFDAILPTFEKHACVFTQPRSKAGICARCIWLHRSLWRALAISAGPIAVVSFCAAARSAPIEAHRFRRRLEVSFADSLVFGNHLGAQQQQRRRKLEAQQHYDGGRQRSIDCADV